MARTKLTLSIDKKVIKEAKTQALLNDSSISDMVEEFLMSIGHSWADELMERLGVKDRYVSYEDVMRRRPKGSDAGKAIRALRYGREKRISG